jgi:protein-S-isoprenylcysteine O-methyltransferase Ste14
VSSGPYAIVRHPMYAGGLVMMLATPIALGSVWGLVFAVLTVGALVWRLLDEEEFLSANLPGYAGYCRTMRYRLVPYLW